MDKDIESRFVRTFLQKRLQDRIIVELESDKRRKTAIHRFCHATDDIVKPQLILLKSKKLSDHEILQIVDRLSREKLSYCISSNVDMDGKQTTIKNAISCCIGYGMPSIIIIGEQVAIIESEQGHGAAYKYIMYADSTRPYKLSNN